jgi:hypothetical protein
MGFLLDSGAAGHAGGSVTLALITAADSTQTPDGEAGGARVSRLRSTEMRSVERPIAPRHPAAMAAADQAATSWRKVFPLLRLHARTSMTILVLTLNQPEKIVNIKFAALAATFLLTSGCALNGPTKPPELPNDSPPVASTTSSGSSSAGTQQASSSSPAGRTRAEVYAEAVEAVKHYQSTQSEERDYFNPYAR